MTSLIEQYEQQYAVSTADFTAKIAKLANVERCKFSKHLVKLDSRLLDYILCGSCLFQLIEDF